MSRILAEAAGADFVVRIFYVGLSSPKRHLERVRHRVDAGGQDIPEADVRRRWQHSAG